MADIAMGATTGPAGDARRAPRLVFIDNIRWSMIVLVLSMHACDSYSPFGNWYYLDRQKTGLGTTLLFGVYQSFLQAFFMAALFFIAGYFSAAAYDRKGFSQFVGDRFVRLGLPTLLYMFVIGPLTQYFLSRTWGTGGFGHQWLVHLTDGEWLSETGPMWFCAALLMFSLVYGLARAAGWRERAVAPTGGGVAKVADRSCLRWAGVALLLSVPLFAALVVFGGGLQGDTAKYSGGFNPVSAGKCLWEALVCVGMGLLMLAVYRRHFNGQGPLARFLSDNAFGVYLIHPPILIGFAILLHGVVLNAVVKALLLTAVAAIGSFAASGFVLRKSPLRAII